MALSPENITLTSAERASLHNVGFTCSDHFPTGTLGHGHAKGIEEMVERVIAARVTSAKAEVLADSISEIEECLRTFAGGGRHTRAWWVVRYLREDVLPRFRPDKETDDE